MRNNKKRSKRQVKNICDVLMSPVFWVGISVLIGVLSCNSKSIINILNTTNILIPRKISIILYE
jgi:hypothetical protein